MFTGDAGQPALRAAAQRLEAMGHVPDVWPLRFVQASHHGSRRNVGPTVLDRLLGAETYSAQSGGWDGGAGEQLDEVPVAQGRAGLEEPGEQLPAVGGLVG